MAEDEPHIPGNQLQNEGGDHERAPPGPAEAAADNAARALMDMDVLNDADLEPAVGDMVADAEARRERMAAQTLQDMLAVRQQAEEMQDRLDRQMERFHQEADRA